MRDFVKLSSSQYFTMMFLFSMKTWTKNFNVPLNGAYMVLCAILDYFKSFTSNINTLLRYKNAFYGSIKKHCFSENTLKMLVETLPLTFYNSRMA